MKKYVCSIAAALMLATSAAPQNPVAPCCNISFINASGNLVLVRNSSTGRLVQFTADAAAINELKTGDAVNINTQANRITAINSAAKNISLREPDPIEPCCTALGANANPAVPCCSIVSIAANPLEPCCAIVSAKSLQNTGNTFRFSVPKEIGSELRIGQSVFFVNNAMRSAQLDPLEPPNGFAILQLKGAGSGASNITTYSYPVGKSGYPAAKNDQLLKKKWEILPNSSLKGMTGRIVIVTPAPSKTLINVYKTGETKQAETWHESNFANSQRTASGNYLPGYYDVAIWNERIDSVRVEVGNDTRVKVGVLDINLKGTWRILDENRKEVYHLSMHDKVMLPEGKYYVATGGMEQPVTVKDGETVNF